MSVLPFIQCFSHTWTDHEKADKERLCATESLLWMEIIQTRTASLSKRVCQGLSAIFTQTWTLCIGDSLSICPFQKKIMETRPWTGKVPLFFRNGHLYEVFLLLKIHLNKKTLSICHCNICYGPWKSPKYGSKDGALKCFLITHIIFWLKIVLF